MNAQEINEVVNALPELVLNDDNFITVSLNEDGDVYIKAIKIADDTIVARTESPSIDGKWKIYSNEEFSDFCFASASEEQSRVNEIDEDYEKYN